MNPKRTTLALSIDVQIVLDNWVKKGDFKGFTKIFLEELALNFKKVENWKALYVVLALPSIGSRSSQILITLWIM